MSERILCFLIQDNPAHPKLKATYYKSFKDRAAYTLDLELVPPSKNEEEAFGRLGLSILQNTKHLSPHRPVPHLEVSSGAASSATGK